MTAQYPTVDSLFRVSPLNNLRLQPEQVLQVSIAAQLRAWRASGELRATWTAIPNELPFSDDMKRVAAMLGVKRKLMGGVPGAPDFVFVWATGGGWIEVKTGGGDSYIGRTGATFKVKKRAPGVLSEEQRRFGDWCESEAARHEVCRSVEQVATVLRVWGCLS
jgi:hypothetical protein